MGVRGICAGESRQVSGHFIAKYLYRLEQETGSITLGAARDWGRPAPQCPLGHLGSGDAERDSPRLGYCWRGGGGLGTVVEKVARDGADLCPELAELLASMEHRGRVLGYIYAIWIIIDFYHSAFDENVKIFQHCHCICYTDEFK